jgi:hypothetical protein
VGLVALQACTSLLQLDIGGLVLVTDEGLGQLLRCCTALEILNCMYCNLLTDAVVYEVAQHLQQLVRIELWGCQQITKEGLEHLRSALPGLVHINKHKQN